MEEKKKTLKVFLSEDKGGLFFLGALGLVAVRSSRLEAGAAKVSLVVGTSLCSPTVSTLWLKLTSSANGL